MILAFLVLRVVIPHGGQDPRVLSAAVGAFIVRAGLGKLCQDTGGRVFYFALVPFVEIGFPQAHAKRS